MIVFRRRLIFWLIKAYIKKSGKTIIFSFILGLLIFFGLLFASRYLTSAVPLYKSSAIGIIGAYRQNNLPQSIVNKISAGLTSVEKDGSIKPQLASSWEISDKGKTYTFHLKKNVFFNDGREVTSDSINYDFSDATVEKPNKYTIVYKLKDAYSPFLITVSKPILEKGYIGVGQYQIKDIKLNGDFVQSLTLVSAKNRFDTIRYLFYPTEEALKLAFLLGEISEAEGLTTVDFNKQSFTAFPNAIVEQKIDYSRLVTVFFNNTDQDLSDKKLRIALSYAIPDEFPQGKRAHLPYSPESIYYHHDLPLRTLDLDHATVLLSSTTVASSSADTLPTLHIKVLKRYKDAAIAVGEQWKKLGFGINIEEVDSVPESFQVFIGDFNLPKDPDQYALWHSSQININNITRFKNLRIDKLLEDGRKSNNINDRIKFYHDFQRYLTEDAPAAFLYFPTGYKVIRN